VSPTYAREITAPENGFGLDGVLRNYTSKLTGILNGVDYGVWDPQTDPLLTTRYWEKDRKGKKACKRDLQRLFRLNEDPAVPVFGSVSRLTSQKGLDLVERALPELMRRNLQFVLLGTGEKHYRDFFTGAAAEYPGRMGVQTAFDDCAAHRVIAGSDIFIMPSHYEPSGLAQLYALKYGAIPIVRATGGLKDSITAYDSRKKTGTGFLFDRFNEAEFLESIDRAIDIYYNRRAWTRLMTNAMRADFSWSVSGQKYEDIYRSLAGR
jgi:starch synthase